MKQTKRFLAALLLSASGLLAAEEMRGLLVLGHEVRSLQLCGDTQVFWVHVPAQLYQQLQTDYRRMAKQPYEPVYVEVEGGFSEHPAGEFAKDYDGTILVGEVRAVSGKGTDACGAAPQTAALKPAVAVNKAATYVFVCDDQTAYTVRVNGTDATVFHPQSTLRLPAVPTKVGTRYSDGAFELKIEGQEAQLGQSGSTLQQCRNDARRAVWEKAKLDGADFRAVGNEPGWHLEILAEGSILLVADYGASRVKRPLPQPTVDPDARTTRWDAGELIVEVIGRPCRDSMSGESFESTVVVTWGMQVLRGCGRALH